AVSATEVKKLLSGIANLADVEKPLTIYADPNLLPPTNTKPPQQSKNTKTDQVAVSGETHFWLAQSLRDTAKEMAAEEYRLATEKNYKVVESYIELGRIHQYRKSFTEAEDDYKRA